MDTNMSAGPTMALNVRIGEHLVNIHKGFDKHSLSKHFAYCHRKDPSSLEVIGIERLVWK